MREKLVLLHWKRKPYKGCEHQTVTADVSTFSAAGAEILKLFTGSDDFGASVTFAAGSSSIEPGLTPRQDVTLRWATFTDAANEAGISRRYGGIHFELGDVVGRATGRLVARQVWEKVLTYTREGEAKDEDERDSRKGQH
jgi:hypothetical protein